MRVYTYPNGIFKLEAFLMKDILFLDPGHAFGLENRTDTFMVANFTLVDQYAFGELDLTPFKCLVVHDFIDQEYLYRQRKKIKAYLNAGNIVVWSGHLVKEWLPGCAIFTPKQVTKHSDYDISFVQAHPIFDGVETDDMTYNKGVAGFFARGSHTPVPQGAEVLITLPDATYTTYIDRTTTRGTIFVHAGRDLFAQRMQAKTTDRISTQLLTWIHEEATRLKEGAQQ